MSAATKHTPERWLVIYGGVTVRMFESRERAEDEAWMADQATDGNVRATVIPLLLADAATDLLAALRDILPWAEDYLKFQHGHAGLRADIAAARAALAKAEGGAS